MKNIMIFLFIVLATLLVSCNDDTPDIDPIDILEDIVESDEAVFNVKVNCAEITSLYGSISVDVTITAKQTIDRILGTSSFLDAGIIEIRLISTDSDDDSSLYSDYFGSLVNAMVLFVHLEEDESLQRIVAFARTPFNGQKGYTTTPVGTYKLQVALRSSNIIWHDTQIIIEVLD